jgi:CubicO group peptidase (beta-lactamase class C family)
LTASALGRLYEKNKIYLDSSVYFYLPDFPKKRYRPTVRQIGGHIGGIRHYKGNEFLIAKRYHTVAEGLKIFQDDSLLFKPATKYQYSSHGFNLLSAIMEKASGKDFLSLMYDEVFELLKLVNTVPDVTDSLISYRSRYYAVDDGKWINTPYVDNSYKWAGGGFLSTSEDLIIFGNALLGKDFLRTETISLLTSTQKLSNGEVTNYGIGFSTRRDNDGVTFFGHSGGSVGGTCNMVIYPEKEVVVVVLTNLTSADLKSCASKIAQLFMK